MNEINKVWLHSDADKLRSLIADEAKQADMLDDMTATLKQLRAKSTFRLALLHQLQESQSIKGNNK